MCITGNNISKKGGEEDVTQTHFTSKLGQKSGNNYSFVLILAHLTGCPVLCLYRNNWGLFLLYGHIKIKLL